GLHLPVKPRFGVRPEAISPTQSRPQMAYPKLAQPANGIVQSMILEVEPLADPDFRRVAVKAAQSTLGTAILSQQSHVKMTIVGGTLRFAMARGGGPGSRQVKKAVPVNP